MQITINTDTDDLPAVIRMLQAYAQPRKLRITNNKDETFAELTASSIKTTNDPIEDEDGPVYKIEGIEPGGVYTGEAIKAALAADQNHCTGHVDYAPETRVEAPTPEPVFTTVENYVGQAGGNGGNGQPPKSLFDAPQPNDSVQPPPHTDVTVDAAGLPWDARIHSGAKSKLANGNWKLLRGVDPALVDSVEAELRGAPSAPPPPVTAPATSTPAPVAPPAPPAPAPPKPITNAAELVAAVMDKRFTTDQVNAACQAVGVDNVASLLAKQDKLPEVLKELGV